MRLWITEVFSGRTLLVISEAASTLVHICSTFPLLRHFLLSRKLLEWGSALWGRLLANIRSLPTEEHVLRDKIVLEQCFSFSEKDHYQLPKLLQRRRNCTDMNIIKLVALHNYHRKLSKNNEKNFIVQESFVRNMSQATMSAHTITADCLKWVIYSQTFQMHTIGIQ